MRMGGCSDGGGEINSFSQKQLKKILDICEEVDFLTKQGQLSPINALHVLVFSIFILP